MDPAVIKLVFGGMQRVVFLLPVGERDRGERGLMGWVEQGGWGFLQFLVEEGADEEEFIG